MEEFDINRVHWSNGKFKPWNLSQKPAKLIQLEYSPDEELIVVEISSKRIAFLQREVVYHHIVQGRINQTDFILTFCGACNAGVLMSPVVNAKVHHFQEKGVYNGQQIFEDIETNTLWNHLTGEGLHGKLKGNILEYIGSLEMTTYAEEMEKNPEIETYISGQKKIQQAIIKFFSEKLLGKNNSGWLPPYFQKTLPEIDDTLPKMTMGLAVKIDNTIRFYPMDEIKEKKIINDTIENVSFDVKMKNNVPVAHTENGEMPFQLFTRWYAFILTYPKGKVYSN